MKKSIVFSFALFMGLGSGTALAQQDALFTQYIDAQLYSNAAAAGSNNVLSFTALHRQQWAGLEGAPMTTGLMIHSPLKYESIGLGMEVWNDRLGSLNRTTVAGSFAYRFKLSGDAKLSFGVKAMADFNAPDLSGISNLGDNPAVLGVQKSTTPNVGVGVLYKSKKMFIGLGVPRILANADSTKNGGYSNDGHAYFLAGGIIGLNTNWKLRPSVQVRYAENSPLSTDVSAAFIYADKIYLGLNYRLLESVGAMVQYQVAPPFKIGYAFDFGTTSLRKSTVGSHEIILSYDMNFIKKDVMSPRYF